MILHKKLDGKFDTMKQGDAQLTPKQRLINRLYSEGWVDCPGLGFPALSQFPTHDLRTFILGQLKNEGGWTRKVDLELAALIFSIPAHEFQVHPQLQFELKRLEAEGLITTQALKSSSEHRAKSDIAIVLTSNKTLQLG